MAVAVAAEIPWVVLTIVHLYGLHQGALRDPGVEANRSAPVLRVVAHVVRDGAKTPAVGHGDHLGNQGRVHRSPEGIGTGLHWGKSRKRCEKHKLPQASPGHDRPPRSVPRTEETPCLPA